MTQTIKLKYSHPNAGPAESFINNTGEQLVEDNTKALNWIKKELILKPFSFRSKEGNTVIHILFFDSQSEAIEFEKVNPFDRNGTIRSVLNGATLYVIEEDNPEKMARLTGLFAGQE